jgi:hypothetical protein
MQFQLHIRGCLRPVRVFTAAKIFGFIVGFYSIKFLNLFSYSLHRENGGGKFQKETTLTTFT